MLVKSYGCAVFGIEATIITVEVNINKGINFFLVGLPDASVKESHQRIMTAFKNNDLKFPSKEITINMAPADIRKEGSAYDLTLACGILAASEQIVDYKKLEQYVIMGELSLDGSLNQLRGVLPIAIEAKKNGYKGVILPIQNANEAAIVSNLEVIGVRNIIDVIDFLNDTGNIIPTKIDIEELFYQNLKNSEIDFSDVKGQQNIKRAFEIAAAGSHNIILIGPPGAGKSMLAKRLPTILPPLSLDEALETTKIHSVVGNISSNESLITQRPFRKPHHTISDVALVGGGTYPQPGEISLAHNGVLFLDELPEYKRTVLEVMRQPLEDRRVSIARAKFSVDYPASFMLVSAMNPCPCGYYNHPTKDCVCPPGMVQKYLNKISGPLLDRIDIHIEVTPVDYTELAGKENTENSQTIRNRVIKARLIQENRYKNNEGIFCNSQMSNKLIKLYCSLDESSSQIIKIAMEKLNLSARAYDRILKVSRTIADLEGCDNIQKSHLAEAIHFRSLDREDWANN